MKVVEETKVIVTGGASGIRGMNQKARDVVAQILVGRIGTPEDRRLAVRFAIECDYFNARTIDVDGGLSF